MIVVSFGLSICLFTSLFVYYLVEFFEKSLSTVKNTIMKKNREDIDSQKKLASEVNCYIFFLGKKWSNFFEESNQLLEEKISEIKMIFNFIECIYHRCEKNKR